MSQASVLEFLRKNEGWHTRKAIAAALDCNVFSTGSALRRLSADHEIEYREAARPKDYRKGGGLVREYRAVMG